MSKNLRVISFNINGIRAGIRKGLLDWLSTDPADVIGLQEIKAREEDLDLRVFEDLGYRSYWFPAQKKGYSGVAVLSHQPLVDVQYGNGHEMSDLEGRWIEWTLEDMRMANAYFPSGTSGDVRQEYKYQWLDECQNYVSQMRKNNKKVLLMGDYNIAHTEVDIHNPVSNKNTSGFLPEERAWMTDFLASGMHDTYRETHPDTRDAYSWWSYRANARANNKGWRIDYITVSDELEPQVDSADILTEIPYSDHCPVQVSLKA